MRLLFLLLISFAAQGQNIIWQESADGYWFNNSYAKLQKAASYSITASTAQKFNGTKSIRFELRDTDPEVQSGTRAEITFPTTTNLNRWYSFAILFPRDGYAYDKSDEVISQWHQGGGKTPALCLRTKGDKLWLRVLGKWVDLGLLDKDKWHAYVMHVKHSSGSSGLVEIWCDGKKIKSYPGPNMYRVTGDIKNPNWKLGIYKSVWNGNGTTQTKKRVLYFDDVKMGSEKASYEVMVPGR